ncbi:hypothetical protein RRF57_013391 [Xylaria bambusicola]|uniref:Uncharacterized protein n=1 Tax=Xylaria bambusicola TaxID=326684 RepID=A0AAN7V1N6_9PEZI
MAVDEIKLLMDFFIEDLENMACGGIILDTSNTRRISKVLRRAALVGNDLVRSYIRQWSKASLL